MTNGQKTIKRGIGAFIVCVLIGYIVGQEWVWLAFLHVVTGIYLCMLAISTGEVKDKDKKYATYAKIFFMGPIKGIISWFKD